MLRRWTWACLVSLIVTPIALQAQSYDIKIKEYPEPGKTIVTKHTNVTKANIKVSVGGMVVQNKEEVSTKEINYETVILEKGDKKPAKYKNTYSKAVETKNGKKSELSYHNRTVVFELKDGNYKVEAEGAPALDFKDLTDLKKTANNPLQHNWSEVLLPRGMIKVGESWDVDVKRITEGLGQELPFDEKQSTAKGTLVKAYKKGNQQFGVVEFDLRLAVSQLGPMKLPKPAIFDLKISFDTAIDGSSTEGTVKMTGKLAAKLNVQQGGMNIGVDMKLSVTDTQVQSAER